MAVRLRVLANHDVPAVMRLTDADPVANLFVRARVAQFGLDRMSLGCEVLGLERDGHLVALCHHGSNMVMVGDDPEAATMFAARIGARRHTSSIMGRAPQVRAIWQALGTRWGTSWTRVRELRTSQPLMVIEGPALVAGDPRVRPVTEDEFAPYFDAAVQMYTEEVGVSPLESTGGYATYVRGVIRERRAFGIIDEGSVWFKSDVGTALDGVCQVQGVWLHPQLRGRGISEPAMAQVVQLCREQFPVVSLYVNDFNTRARRLYERVGFSTVDEFATVLY